MSSLDTRYKYLKNVLGVKFYSPHLQLAAVEPNVAKETSEINLLEGNNEEKNAAKINYQIRNNGDVLFLSLSGTLQIPEMQLLEKIIFALKIPFQKVDIANIENSNSHFQPSTLNYKHIFLMGEENAQVMGINRNEFKIYHPLKMNSNPDLKKEVWNFFKTIMPSLARI